MEVEERLIKTDYLLLVGPIMYILGKCEIRDPYSLTDKQMHKKPVCRVREE